MKLPFLGEWTVSQGYNGKITHLGEWKNALDFVITDNENKTYSSLGTSKNDFYCYNKPIMAPADGYVYQISNITNDNNINEVNTKKNYQTHCIERSQIFNHKNMVESYIKLYKEVVE